MFYFVFLFLITGFIIGLLDIFKYKLYLKNINTFKKEVLNLKKILLENPINTEKMNLVLNEILEKYQNYINSDVDIVFVPDYFLKMNILITSHWMNNLGKYLKDTAGYPFETLLEYIDFTLNECAMAKGKNLYSLRKAYINMIPFYYFGNCFNFLISQFSIRDKKITEKHGIWLPLTESISFIANIFAIFIPILNHFFGFKF